MSDRYDHPDGKPFRGIVLVVGLWLVVALLGVTWCSAHARERAPITAFRKEHPCPSTGKTTGSCPGFVVDHAVPLCWGGADDPSNLIWQEVQQSYRKDVFERAACKLKKANQDAG